MTGLEEIRISRDDMFRVVAQLKNGGSQPLAVVTFYALKRFVGAQNIVGQGLSPDDWPAGLRMSAMLHPNCKTT